jgi:hypothetical protein
MLVQNISTYHPYVEAVSSFRIRKTCHAINEAMYPSAWKLITPFSELKLWLTNSAVPGWIGNTNPLQFSSMHVLKV